MSYRDIISALRMETPNAEKASRWLKYAGLGCLAVTAWNVACVFFDPVAISELPIPPYFNQGLALLAVAGCLFIIAGRGVAEKSPGAVLWGQMAVIATATGAECLSLCSDTGEQRTRRPCRACLSSGRFGMGSGLHT